jgi:hypothetical protein
MNASAQKFQRNAAARLREHKERVLSIFVEAVRLEITEARQESKSILRNSLPYLLGHLEEALGAPVERKNGG